MKIVITGCSNGIGLELVKILTESHTVYGLSRNTKKLEKLKSSLINPHNFLFQGLFVQVKIWKKPLKKMDPILVK